MGRVPSTIKYPLRTLGRAWTVSRRTKYRQENAPRPYEDHAMNNADNHVEAVVEEPIEEPVRHLSGHPDVDYIEGCRILHKRDPSEGLCEKCQRWRDRIEEICRKHEEAHIELYGRPPGPRKKSGEGEGDGDGDVKSVDTPVKKPVEAPVKTRATDYRQTYAMMPTEQKSKTYQELCREGRELARRYEEILRSGIWIPGDKSRKYRELAKNDQKLREKLNALARTYAPARKGIDKPVSAMTFDEKRTRSDQLWSECCELSTQSEELARSTTLGHLERAKKYQELANRFQELAGLFCELTDSYGGINKGGQRGIGAGARVEKPAKPAMTQRHHSGPDGNLLEGKNEHFMRTHVKKYAELYSEYSTKFTQSTAHRHAMDEASKYSEEDARKRAENGEQATTVLITQPYYGHAGKTDEGPVDGHVIRLPGRYYTEFAELLGQKSESLRRTRDELQKRQATTKKHRDELIQK